MEVSLTILRMTDYQREGFWLTDARKVSGDEVRFEISSKNIDTGAEVAILSEQRR